MANAGKAPPAAIPAPTETLVPYSWVILAVSLAVQTSASFASQAISPLAPFLQGAFGISRAEIGLLASATFGGGLVALSAGGRLSDRFGVRLLFVAGLALLGAFLLLAGFAAEFWWLLVFMFIGGIGNGLALPPTTRAIMFWFPARIRGIVMSIKQTGVALAGSIMGVTVPALAFQVGWNGALLIIGAVVLVISFFALVLYRESPAENLSRTGGSAGSVRMLDLLRQRDFLLFGTVSYIFAGVQLSAVNFLVLYLGEALAIGLVAAGSLYALAQLSGVFARVGWGMVSDLVFGGRRRIVLMIIGTCTAAVLGSLTRLPADSPGWLVALLMILVGASAIGWNGVSLTFVAEMAGRDRSATAAGMNLTCTYFGIMTFPPAFGWIVDRSGGSYTGAFLLLAAAMLIAVVILSRLRRVARCRSAGEVHHLSVERIGVRCRRALGEVKHDGYDPTRRAFPGPVGRQGRHRHRRRSGYRPGLCAAAGRAGRQGPGE